MWYNESITACYRASGSTFGGQKMELTSIPSAFRDPISNIITIYGYIPNNDNPTPATKPNGKPVDPDPLSRICNRVKKRFLAEDDVCVFYHINRSQNFDGHFITTISFMFSNTGKNAITLKTAEDKEKFRELSSTWEGLMSMYIHEDIESYINFTYKA